MDMFWKNLYERSQEKNAKLKAELQKRNERLKAERRSNKETKLRMAYLQKALWASADNMVTEYCDGCGWYQTFWWDSIIYGQEAYCPFCGEKIIVGRQSETPEHEKEEKEAEK